MALNSIGYYDFGNQYGAVNQQAQGGRFLAAQVTNLGDQISKSLSENAQRKEATAMAPMIANSYKIGFEQIQAGNIGEGLGNIYATGAMAGQNPFLARMAQDATQAAGYIANNKARTQSMNEEYNRRQGLINERYAQEGKLWKDTHPDGVNGGIGATGGFDANGQPQQPQPKPLTPAQKLAANGSYTKQFNTLLDDMGEATTDEEFKRKREQLKNVILMGQQIGLAVDAEGVFASASPEEKAKIKEAADKLKVAQKELDGWHFWWTNTEPMKEKVKELRATLTDLTDASHSALERERQHFDKRLKDQSEAQGQPVIGPDNDVIPLGGMPTDPNAQTSPIVPANQGTPDQQRQYQEYQASQADEDRQKYELWKQVSEKKMSAQEARKIAAEKGWE